jgi:hypothetical protein
MATYRLISARLMAQSYGDSFTPESTNAPQVLAENFDNVVKIKDVLSERQNNWRSTDLTDLYDVFSEAGEEIATELGTYGGESYTVVIGNDSGLYRPIYDKNGNQVAHDTIGWLSLGDAPVSKVLMNGELVGLIAYVYLAVEPE